MEPLRRTWTQFSELFGAMSLSQRGTLIGITLMLLAGFAWLMVQGQTRSNFVPVSVGKSFTTEEIVRAEEAFLQAGLTDFERKGQRIMVPSNQVEAYNAALISSGSMPQNWAEEWEKQFAEVGPFANNKQLADRKEIARAKLASQMVAAIPEVETANVVWDHEELPGWPRRTRSKATVFVRPKPGRELSSPLVHSIRLSISGMKADLAPDHVTIFDVVNGVAHEIEDPNDPFNGGMIQRINQLKEMYRAEILRSIDYIKGVRVSVNVDIERVKSAIRRLQKMDSKGGVNLLAREDSSIRTLNQQPTKSEPGQNANGALALPSSPGQQRSEQVEDRLTEQVTAPTYEVTQEDIIGAMPQNVQVSVAIPEEYYRMVAIQQTGLKADAPKEEIDAATTKVREEVNLIVQKRVTQIIPAGTRENPATGVDVSSFIAFESEPPAVETSILETTQWAVSQWGSAIVMTIFALWAMMALNKTVSRTAKATPPPPVFTPPAPKEDATAVKDKDLIKIDPPDTRNRDSLQFLVKDNPEMSAAILSKWIRDAM